MNNESISSANKKPSPELFSLIKAAATNLLGFGELWASIKKKGHDEGFSEKQLQDMLRPHLKEKLDSKKVWYLFHKEEEHERNTQNYQSRTFKRTNDDKKEPEQSPIPLEPVGEKESEYLNKIPQQPDPNWNDDPDEEIEKMIPKLPVKDSEQFYKEQGDLKEKGVFSPEDTEEEPTPLELAEIKIKQLEEALKKVQHFQPANKLEQRDEHGTDESKVFDWLAKRDDKTKCFFFDSYGFELFKSRILKNLDNSGIKVFKRLYFEV